MTKLGIIGAMDEEVETLLAAMTNRREEKAAGCTFHEGKLAGLPAVVVQCGIGKVNAAMCTQAMIDKFAVSAIVNTGIAGSLSPMLDIGDLVVSQDAMYHDFDCVHFGYPMGKVPGSDVTAFPADETLMAYAFSAADSIHPGHVRLGRVTSGDQFVSSAEAKKRIIAVTSALCTEMEGTAIAQTAYRNGIPFVVLRAISDKADDSAQMDYPTFERQAAHRCAQIVQALAEKLLSAEQA